MCVVCAVRLCRPRLEYLKTGGSLVILWHLFTPSIPLPPLQLVYFLSHALAFLPRGAFVKSGQMYL